VIQRDRVVKVETSNDLTGSRYKRTSISRTDYNAYISTGIRDGDVAQRIEPRIQIIVLVEFVLS